MAARLTALVVALIVGVTLVAGLIVGAQRNDDSGPIDLLIYNGRVYTGDGSEPFAEALAIRGNRIYRVGSNREIKRLRHRATTVIDAHGGSVLPGFSDAHPRLPLPASASATGELAPSSAAPVSAPSTPAAASELADAVRGAHRLGVTSVSTVVETADELRVFDAAGPADGLSLRVAAALRVTPPLDQTAWARLDAARRAHGDDPFFRTSAVALRASLDVRDPREKAPRTSTARGQVEPVEPVLAPLTVSALAELDRRGWTVVLQVEDERELTAAVDALAGLSQASAAPAEGRRHRIELSRPMAVDVPRLKSLGVALAVPLAATWAPELTETASDVPASGAPAASAGSADVPAPVVGETLAGTPVEQYSGVRLLVASESLVDPRLGLQALVASPRQMGAADTSESPVRQAALAAAIDAYTSTAAWASSDERQRGVIARDKLADLVILSTDLFTLSADKLLDAVVTVTIFDGKVVYDRATEAEHTDQ